MYIISCICASTCLSDLHLAYGQRFFKILLMSKISYSPLQLEPTFWGFPYKTPIHYVCRKLPKHYVKFPKFSSIACINVGSFSMSFGSKIISGSWVASLQLWKYKKVSFSKEKWKFQQLKSPKPLKISQPKLMEKLPILMQATEEKLGNFA